MFKKYFQKFLNQNEGKLHFAAHSHHYWPDITREAQLRYWDDSAKYVDQKWEYFFSHEFRELQSRISKVLNTSNPNQITFAPNTHELATRILSCFPKGAKVLTTDSEFYSFERQINRLAEEELLEVNKIKNTNDEAFIKTFIKEANTNKYDLIFISQVFFNSGFAITDLNNFVKSISCNAQIVIDAYHAFMAIPTDLREVEDRIFYLAGGYKYCGSGEGSCFLTSPKNTPLTPINTGWFAQMGELKNFSSDRVPFSDDGFRFAGSTMDFSAIYRMNSVLKLWNEENVTVDKIHNHVIANQKLFLDNIKDTKLNTHLIPLNCRGHFIAFSFQTSEECEQYATILRENNVDVDFRRNILRFGFSIYQSSDDIIKLVKIINHIN